MKKSNFLKIMLSMMFVLTMGLFITSCDDEERDQDTTKKILGKWYLEKIDVKDKTVDWVFVCPEKKDFFEFLADNSLIEVIHNKNCEEKIKVKTDWKLVGTDKLVIKKKITEKDLPKGIPGGIIVAGTVVEVHFEIAELDSKVLIVKVEKIKKDGITIPLGIYGYGIKPGDIVLSLKRL